MTGRHTQFLAPHDEPVIVFRRAFNAPARLVSTFAYEAAPETEVLDEVTFDQADGTTLVTGRSAFPTFQARDLYLARGAERGLAGSHDRLDELLSTFASRPRERQGP